MGRFVGLGLGPVLLIILFGPLYGLNLEPRWLGLLAACEWRDLNGFRWQQWDKEVMDLCPQSGVDYAVELGLLCTNGDGRWVIELDSVSYCVLSWSKWGYPRVCKEWQQSVVVDGERWLQRWVLKLNYREVVTLGSAISRQWCLQSTELVAGRTEKMEILMWLSWDEYWVWFRW